MINTNNTQRIHDLRRLGMGPTADAFQAVVDQLADCRRLLSEQAEELASLGSRNFRLAIDAQRTVDQVRDELADVRTDLEQERRNREEVGHLAVEVPMPLSDEELQALVQPIQGVIEPRPYLPSGAEMLDAIHESKRLAHSVHWIGMGAFLGMTTEGRNAFNAKRELERGELLPAPDVEFIEADLCARCGGGGIDPIPHHSSWLNDGSMPYLASRPCIECNGSGISQAADYDQAFSPVHDDEEGISNG